MGLLPDTRQTSDIDRKHPQYWAYIFILFAAIFRFFRMICRCEHLYAVSLYIENLHTETDNTILYRYIKVTGALTHHYSRIETLPSAGIDRTG